MICSQTRLVGIGIDGQQMLFILFYFISFALKNTKKKNTVDMQTKY